MVRLTTITAALRELGLIVRGGFHPHADDDVPALSDGKPVRTLVMVGNAGPAMWTAFRASSPDEAGEDSLNAWTKRATDQAADELGGQALFPFSGPPYFPFQRWAQRSESVWSSPIGILIHADYGLWHAYRVALVFAERLELPARADERKPCDACAQRPCLSSCPVGAFTEGHYDVPRCIAHISSDEGRDCVALGCRARRGCPIGRAYQYEPAHAEFHMHAFLKSNLKL